MPRHEITYDQELKETQEWRVLYSRWLKIRRKYTLCQEWETMEGFYAWAMSVGVEPGDRLYIHDEKQPIGPDNCAVIKPNCEKRVYGKDLTISINRWNKTVNRLRKHFGMVPFPET